MSQQSYEFGNFCHVEIKLGDFHVLNNSKTEQKFVLWNPAFTPYYCKEQKFPQIRWPKSSNNNLEPSRAVDSALISSRIKPMPLKSVFTASLLDAQHWTLCRTSRQFCLLGRQEGTWRVSPLCSGRQIALIDIS